MPNVQLPPLSAHLMRVEDAKQKKLELEKLIYGAISSFNKDTGLQVTMCHVSYVQHIFGADSLVRVHLEVTLP